MPPVSIHGSFTTPTLEPSERGDRNKTGERGERGRKTGCGGRARQQAPKDSQQNESLLAQPQ